MMQATREWKYARRLVGPPGKRTLLWMVPYLRWDRANVGYTAKMLVDVDDDYLVPDGHSFIGSCIYYTIGVFPHRQESHVS